MLILQINSLIHVFFPKTRNHNLKLKSLVRNILSLVTSGSYSEARGYVGKLLRRVFVDLTTSDQLCDGSTSHKHRIRAYMEAQLTTTIDRVSEQR